MESKMERYYFEHKQHSHTSSICNQIHLDARSTTQHIHLLQTYARAPARQTCSKINYGHLVSKVISTRCAQRVKHTGRASISVLYTTPTLWEWKNPKTPTALPNSHQTPPSSLHHRRHISHQRTRRMLRKQLTTRVSGPGVPPPSRAANAHFA